MHLTCTSAQGVCVYVCHTNSKRCVCLSGVQEKSGQEENSNRAPCIPRIHACVTHASNILLLARCCKVPHNPPCCHKVPPIYMAYVAVNAVHWRERDTHTHTCTGRCTRRHINTTHPHTHACKQTETHPCTCIPMSGLQTTRHQINPPQIQIHTHAHASTDCTSFIVVVIVVVYSTPGRAHCCVLQLCNPSWLSTRTCMYVQSQTCQIKSPHCVYSHPSIRPGHQQQGRHNDEPPAGCYCCISSNTAAASAPPPPPRFCISDRLQVAHTMPQLSIIV